MNYPRILVATLVMALVTYLIRAIPLLVFRKKIQNVYVQSFLFYVPYAVLGAMTFPDILMSTGNLAAGIVGFLAALIMAWRNKGLLTVALSATAAAFITERLLFYCLA